MAIVDDKLLCMRLAARPEFHARLVEFLFSYQAVERAALVVQARPSAGSVTLDINVSDPDVQKCFLAGARTDNGWWHGFRSMTSAQPVFHGVASLPSREGPTWASEVHRDGHFIAGIWSFPALSVQGGDVDVLPDFYADIFRDFLHVVQSTIQGLVEPAVVYETTWTLTNVSKLHYANRSTFGQFRVAARPLQIPHLQSRISEAHVGTPEWDRVALRMSQELTGAYGDIPRST